jgi:hypothetical protein
MRPLIESRQERFTSLWGLNCSCKGNEWVQSKHVPSMSVSFICPLPKHMHGVVVVYMADDDSKLMSDIYYMTSYHALSEILLYHAHYQK